MAYLLNSLEDNEEWIEAVGPCTSYVAIMPCISIYRIREIRRIRKCRSDGCIPLVWWRRVVVGYWTSIVWRRGSYSTHRQCFHSQHGSWRCNLSSRSWVEGTGHMCQTSRPLEYVRQKVSKAAGVSHTTIADRQYPIGPVPLDSSHQAINPQARQSHAIDWSSSQVRFRAQLASIFWRGEIWPGWEQSLQKWFWKLRGWLNNSRSYTSWCYHLQ